MNAIQALSAHPGVERLGAALLHFLWEGVLIAAVYAAARRAARTSAASVRYLLACGALASMAAAVVLTWSMPAPAAPARVAAALPPPASMAASGAVQNISLMFLGGVNRAAPASLLPWVVAVWLAGATALWLRLLGGWILTERLRFRLALPAPREWQRALDRLATRVRVSRPARLLVSALVDAPGVVGWLRPVVLVPAGALTGLPPEQVEALLLHELAHIRRHDYLVNILQSAVEALLFHHPAVWWISGHIRAERELCCDDATVRVTGDAITYARALAGLGPARFGTAMAASGGPLAQRIARLLGQSRPAARTLSGPGIVAAALLLAAAAFAVFGQPADRPRFEVASVKPAADRGGSSVRPLPGRLTTDAPLRLIMENAYAVQSFQVVGGPDWVDSEHYAIEAKAAGNPSHAQIFLMLQALLEDRFQLKIHRETRELPIYALAPARSGVKLAPAKEDGCADPAPGAPAPWAGGRIQPPGRGLLPPAPCGRARVMLEPAGARMQGGKIGMPELVRSLSMVLGRTVIDKTGFTGLFDFQLDFVPDETTSALPPPPPGGEADTRFPPMLMAIQQQLGLRLESTKGPVEVIVIDHVGRPSAN